MQRILIVDDNEDIQEVLATYVAKEGFEPVVAKDGFEALDLFKGNEAADRCGSCSCGKHQISSF